ncbi:GNAT family N-acetyltransferase [Cryptosporangium phraense]|uniref:GNAT family N-acetyltransferase n=1 Tax=Cryptosporangium phraense TaxID=2593070 RepID=A0A545ADV9_9ACTN|nr:GNAT family N-acetyltransferase [Cryptosporangium phraense]TQS39512.1 GNAT family N-acetyltransferase [Cryptosporangium phraense]
MHPTLRPATAADAPAIARLHADSWRRHYRGAYADSFLDGDVLADRRAVWESRLAAPAASTTTPGAPVTRATPPSAQRASATTPGAPGAPGASATIIAEYDDRAVGFVHIVFDHDPRWGSLVDNLHVTDDRRRTGVGTHLLRAAARAVADRGSVAMYLWVLEQNTSAQAFYTARGATRGETTPVPGDPARLNGSPRRIRMIWPDAPATFRPEPS